MAKFVFGNNVSSTLGSAAGAGDTTLTLAAGTGSLFPHPISGQQAAATLQPAGSTTGPWEIVYYTGVSGDTLTGVSRAQEGTAAAAWAVGAQIASLWTKGQAGALAQLVDVQQQTGNFAIDSSSTANEGIVTLTPAPTSQAALLGSPLRIQKNGLTNSGAYVLNVNGFGDQPVTFLGTALIANDLMSALIFEVVWDGAEYQVLTPTPTSTSPSGPAGGDLTGTYPNPSIAAGAVSTAKMAPGAVNNSILASLAVATGNIQLNAVTNAVLAQAGANTLKGNLTGSTANVSDNSLTAVEAAIALTGDVGGVASANAINSHAVTNGKLAQAPAATLKGNLSGGTADVTDNNQAAVLGFLGIVLPTRAQFRLQQPSGTASGETLNNNAYTARALNTVVLNNIPGASGPGGGVITLPAGTYLVQAFATASSNSAAVSAQHKLRLFDNTHSVTLVSGLNTQITSTGQPVSSLQGQFTLGATANVELDSYFIGSAGTGNGGAAMSTGDVEVYADVFLTKIA